MSSPSCHVPLLTRRNTIAAGDEVKIAERTKLIPGNDKGQMPPSFELTSKIITERPVKGSFFGWCVLTRWTRFSR